MKATAFDGMTRELGETTTRRSFFRLLGGAAALGAGLAMSMPTESLAKGKGHGHEKAKAPARRNVQAQGKKTKKITICHQSQTRQVKKQGWAKKYPGATSGACPSAPQPCTRWILSGGPDPATPITVDDELTVFILNGSKIIDDKDQGANTFQPPVFPAQVGDVLYVYAHDVHTTCRSLSPLWLHCLATGQKRQLFAGQNDGCASGRSPETFVFEQFQIGL